MTNGEPGRRDLNLPSPVVFLTTMHERKGIESPVSGDDVAMHKRFTRIMRSR